MNKPNRLKQADEAESLTALADRLKALSHPVRLAILRELSCKGHCCCGTLVNDLPVAQSTVSQHLKILKDAGFVTLHAEGQRSRYAVNHAAFATFAASFDTHIRPFGSCLDTCLGTQERQSLNPKRQSPKHAGHRNDG